jgi:hypothetical protein
MTVRAAVFFQLGGDIDILAPVLLAARADGLEYRVIVSDKLERSNARLGVMLSALDAAIDAVVASDAEDALLAGAVSSVDALITASETTLRPHALAYRLTLAAKAAGVATFTIQHGVENVGLTYFDDRQGREVVFASDYVLIWSRPCDLPDIVDPVTKAKAVGVGYSAPPTHGFEQVLDELGVTTARGDFVGVFENLHWTRYSDDYRQRFLADLEATCRQFPHLTFLFKPHPEGRWLTKRYLGARPVEPNLLVADPESARWSLITAPSLVTRLAAVITTPSKTALDAAVAGTPVAVAAYDDPCAMYAELPMLRNEGDWRSFVGRAIADRNGAQPSLEAFRRRVTGGGAGASDIVRIVRSKTACR